MIVNTFDTYAIISLHGEGFFYIRGWNFLPPVLG